MQLNHGLHLAYCTNIHRGETWVETFAGLERHTLAVRDRVGPGRPYAIGLRLSAAAAIELSDARRLLDFRRWLDRENCYVFTINGFPFGKFHGGRVKEQVYLPDWTSPDRVAYTNLLFDLLAQIVPAGVAGSVSTVPGSFKEFIQRTDQVDQMRRNLWQCVNHIAELSERTGRHLHLGLEPEPLCYLETSQETVDFYEHLREDRPGDPRLERHLGVNYDTCHLACEFEEAATALEHFRDHRVPLSKLHLSSALKVRPTPAVRAALRAFADDIYFHQVIERRKDNSIRRVRDLDVALRETPLNGDSDSAEWRIHFHIPLHSQPTELFDTTSDHLVAVLDALARNPALCQHLEMETYTWEVLPEAIKNRDVVDQLVGEYEWTLARLAERGLAPMAPSGPRSNA